jgi:mannosyltransferase
MSALVEASSSDARRTLRARELVVALTLLGAALRFSTLNVQSIWQDEAATLILVHRGLTGTLSHLSASESSPPLYYVLVWLWTRLFGAGPLGFRSFSALVGCATIPAMYFAGRQVSTRVGVWAAVLTTVNPAMYYYSQEARDYGLLVLFSAIAYTLWQRALREPSARHLAQWAFLSALALLTHYFAVFLFLPQAWILARRAGWRRVWAPVAAVVLVGAALVPLAASQRASGKVDWIEEASLPSRIGETAKLFFVGVYGPVEILLAAVGALFAAGVLVLLYKRGDRRELEGARDAALVLAGAFAVPLALAATHAVDVYDGRNVIGNWVPFALLLACGLGITRAPRATAALGGGLVTLSLAVIAAINLIPAYQRDDWRGVAHALGSGRVGRVIVSERFGEATLSIYLPEVRATSARTVLTREVAYVSLRVRHTGGAPSPAPLPTRAPAGFHLAGVTRSEAFAVARYLAPRATVIATRALPRISPEAATEVIIQS